MVQVWCCGVWGCARTRLCVLVACATIAQLQAASAGPYSPSPLSGDYHCWLIKPRAQAPSLISSQIPTCHAELSSSKLVWLSQVGLAAQSKRVPDCTCIQISGFDQCIKLISMNGSGKPPKPVIPPPGRQSKGGLIRGITMSN